VLLRATCPPKLLLVLLALLPPLVGTSVVSAVLTLKLSAGVVAAAGVGSPAADAARAAAAA
jgi:hypothetical protein